MSLQACADLVARGDPDRFAAAMAAPVAARRVLFPFYAFNLEIARAPWVTAEPLIAEMRLQWWADALDEIAAGGPVRRHEVTEPLAEVLAPGDTVLLQRNIDARRRDARGEPMANVQELRGYVEDTSASLMWAVTRALEPEHDWGPPVHLLEDPDNDRTMNRTAVGRAFSIGGAQGLANYLLAVPEFLARGRNPLPDMSEAAYDKLLGDTIALSEEGQYMQAKPPRRAERIAGLAAWRARGILMRARRDPSAVPEGRLEEAPIRRNLALLWARRGL